MSTKANDVATPSQTTTQAAPAAADAGGAKAGAKPGAAPKGNPAAVQPAAGAPVDAGKGGVAGVPGKPVGAEGSGALSGAEPAVKDEAAEKKAAADGKAFAALTKRENALRADRESYENEKRTFDRTFAGFTKLRETAKTDPLEAVRIVLGCEDKLSAQKLVIRAAAGRKESDAERIDRLEKEKADEKRQAATAEEKRQHEAQIEGIRAKVAEKKDEIAALVVAKPEESKFLTIEEGFAKGRAADLVYAVMDKHFRNTVDPATGRGEILEVSEAVKRTEAFLAEKARKYSGALNPPADATTPKVEPPTGGKDGPSKKAAPKAPAAGQAAAPNDKQPDVAPPNDGKKPRSRREEFEMLSRDPRFARKGT